MRLDVPWSVEHANGDTWYRCTFSGEGDRLVFHGLATIVDVYLNGALILQSDNMFVRHSVPVQLQASNELAICVHPLDLQKKRPRPRWKTRLVEHQNLRWYRTSLYGRIPGWTPPNPIEGPWRAITLESGDEVVPDVQRARFHTIDEDFRIDGERLFLRGATWTMGDSLNALRLLRDAGANMVRVGGTFVYGDDAFYDACDELDLLVWQDFMFANMDYPADDPDFLESVRVEATQQIERLRRHPSVVIWCGNSEVEQQAAMLGMPRELWRNRIFGELLPSLVAELHPQALYIPSTPSGGTLPFQTKRGVTHYYGVGAYLRPLTDVRRAEVRFATECLGFANVPERDVEVGHKRGVPHDTGASWDFEDVRDHYLQEVFGVDPMHLRYADNARYLDLSRVVTGEVMTRVYSEWRSAYSDCRGALVWFLQDLEPGAGWGILDSRGVPKPCYWYLRRVWQPRTVVFTDEGLNGLHAHVVNQTEEPLHCTLQLTFFRDGHVATAQGSVDATVAPRSVAPFEAEAILGAFYDSAYAYRFGPPSHEVAVATLIAEGNVIAEAFHFPLRQPPRMVAANVTTEVEGNVVHIESDRFLYGVHFDAAGFMPDDNWFHLVPGRRKTVKVGSSVPRSSSGSSGLAAEELRGTEELPPLRGYLEALNLPEPVRIS
jgi:beta-mannosidase